MNLAQLEARTERATDQVLDQLVNRGTRYLVVDSPPGAGKTYLVEDITSVAVEYGMRLAVVAPTSAQVYDLVRRLVDGFPRLPLQILHTSRRPLPQDLRADPRVPRPVSNPSSLPAGPCVVVGTVAKFILSVDRIAPDAFDALVCDESYQVMYKDFAPLDLIARQKILVGDPGQLPPLVEVEAGRFEAAPVKVHWAAPRMLLRRMPGVPVVRLPVTRRLLQDTVDIVQPAFYGGLPFASTVDPKDRRLRFPIVGLRDPIDRALDLVVRGASIVALLLPRPSGPIGAVDDELARLAADVTARVLERGAEWVGERALLPEDIGIADPHHASGAAIRRYLGRAGVTDPDIKIDSLERWQGLQRPIMVVRHPLSGPGRWSEFDLEPGRWSVALSRHLLGCIVVGRDGVAERLDSHDHDAGAALMGADDDEWRGWLAHTAIWQSLSARRRLIRVR